jgi:hypothetical protein
VYIFDNLDKDYQINKFLLDKTGWVEKEKDFFQCGNYTAELKINHPEIGQLSLAYNLIPENINHETSKVFICGGDYSYAFHSSTNCRGLNNCKGKIYSYQSQNEAIKAKYNYCEICWK